MKRETLETSIGRSTPNHDGIVRRFDAQIGRRIKDLTVVVNETGVVLRGKANSYYLKQLAQHALMRATPLPIVANEIEVG
jgi:hypothetical protein